MFTDLKWVNEFNETRENEYEFLTLFHKLQKYSNKFFEYCHMDETTFNLILDDVRILTQFFN